MVLGLTGGIGTGKSTVGKILQKKGYPIVDTDIIAREVVQSTEILEKLQKEFGKEIVENGKLNRNKLGQIVFKDKNKLNMLNSIMHPAILKKMWKEVEILKKNNKHIFVDVPLLFEINIEKSFDKVVLIYANRNIQVNRIMLRDGKTKDEALNVINSQMDIEIKKEKSDYIIINENSLEELENNINNILEEIEKSDKNEKNN